MEHIQEYYNTLGQLYTSPQQPRSQSQSHLFYDITSVAACPEVSMAQSSLQSSFRPEAHIPQPQWLMSQTSSFNNMMFEQTQLRGHRTPSSDDMIWSGLPNEPHIDEPVLSNNELLYSHDASQNTLRKASDFGNSSFWFPNGMPNTAPCPSADILMSPASPLSDVKQTYSPGSDYSPETPKHIITGYGTKVLSPNSAPYTPQPAIQQHQGASIQYDFGVPMTSVGVFPMSNTFDEATMYGSEHSYEQSQSSSRGMTPWYSPGDVGEKAAIAQDPQDQQADTLLFDHRPHPYFAPLKRSSRQRQEQWSNKNAVPAQSHFQTRFMAPPTDSEKAQRSEDDKILMEMKQEGYTYKDIRKKLGRKVAESTLRGRYRSLTKPRSARLRSPKWQDVDIVLMRHYVQEEFDKLDYSQPSLDAKQKPNKIPWAKIADRMAANGGSYKFGAATVKSKWRETSQSTAFQLRFCPSLAKKPIPKLEKSTPTPKKHFDPFDNPSPNLHIADIPTNAPSHLLVLNKFPIIAGHFILATKTNKAQTHILEQDDLEATYACLKAWSADNNDKRLFAFFNSGEHSGASQPHRHLQFLPVENMREGEVTNGWDLLIDLILKGEQCNSSQCTGKASCVLDPNITFAHFGRRFDGEPTGEQLVEIYNELYGLARDAVDGFITKNPGEFALHPSQGGDLPISYNLAMTTAGMVVLPRRSEGTMLRRSDGSDIGFVALNGTTLGGTMLVKNQGEWDVLRSQRGKLDSILDAIGIPRDNTTAKAPSCL
ncbi:bifunctional AP-4-A phosphorylase/ADP sulfurylase [Didymella heteroderae]|uniref:Bifunctional AP-4-A phosphorylase/ADP sulfurylase n=1 Tax=Didymella heteroderae TaxID=1769908 RepID=A0A9P4WXG4_9PLEO|nr:bifunctional AP-4-A phosphorylase/ADP sulfurylase [Didymella heteroderae]